MKNNRIVYVIIAFLGFMIAGIVTFIISVADMGFVFAPFIMAFTFFIMGVVIIIIIGSQRKNRNSDIDIPTCPKCNTRITTKGDYCPFCAADLRETNNCPYCGHQNPYDAQTCQECNGLLK